KFYKRDGWYWIFAPAGGVATGWQSVFRSRSPYGPYESRIVLEQGDTPVNGPHQGAWVDTPTGENWFLHFQDRGLFGRVLHLQPMTWGGDGWPRMGTPRPDGRGEPAATFTAPGGATTASGTRGQREPERSDDFTGTVLGPQWHWQANPQPDWATLRGDGTLRLALVAVDRGRLRQLPCVLSQQIPGRPSVVTTSLRLESEVIGARAGLLVLGVDYAWIGLVRSPAGVHLVGGRMAPAGAGDTLMHPGRVLACPPEAAGDAPEVSVRATTGETGLVTFSWSLDDRKTWQHLPVPFQAMPGEWIGAEIGVFACAPTPSGGHSGGCVQGSAVFGAVEFAIQSARGEGTS
ncbi:MAG TPA: family 43 glycosylhydrolase, partial [Dermatophilaceae bacterium]